MRGKTIAERAWEIFEQEQRPLHYRELTDLILKQTQLGGKTPAQSVRSAIGTNDGFKRVAEGVYCPTEWDKHPRARFGKDIAYDILSSYGVPMGYRELGQEMLNERVFKGRPDFVALNSTANDKRFYLDKVQRKISLSEWQNIE